MTVAVSSVVSDQEAVEELRAAWVQVSSGYARFWTAMAEVAGRTTPGWESAEIAAALTFTTRRADYELSCAQVLIERLPLVYAALAAGELDHHKARVFVDYLGDVPAAQAERVCERLAPVAPGWTTGQLAARLLREIQAIDPDYTRRNYQRAVRERAVYGYLDHTGTAVLSGSGLPAAEAAAAAARLETLADDLRATGYPATVNQARADLYLRLLDGTLDGLSRAQILTTMLRLGPLTPADNDLDTQPRQQPDRDQPNHHSSQRPAPEPPAPATQPDQPNQHEPTPQPSTGGPDAAETSRPVRPGIEVWVRLSTLLGLDDHPAELPSWGPVPAATARDLVAAQHNAEWRIAIVDTQGWLLHGGLTRRRPAHPGPPCDRGDCVGGIVEIAIPVSMLDRFPTLASDHPQWGPSPARHLQQLGAPGAGPGRTRPAPEPALRPRRAAPACPDA